MTSRVLADFASGIDLVDVPSKALIGAKGAIADCLGVLLAGADEPAPATLREALGLSSTGGSGARIVATRFRAPAPVAALVNGTAAHALDFDDSSESMFGHPSACLVPALLALADGAGIHGADLLAGYVAGFEVASKLGAYLPDSHYLVGWHNTSTLGSLGAAAACARALRLDTDRTVTALGIAASLAAGLRVNFGTMTKPLHAGNAARNGVLAGTLAAGGFTADRTALEGEHGFTAVFAHGPTSSSSMLEKSLGNPFELDQPGVRIKLYPSCTSTHRPVEAVISLALKYDLDPQEVVEVRCGVCSHVPGILIRNMAVTGPEAKFSLHYCVARALIDRQLTIGDFNEERVNELTVRRLMECVTMYVHPGEGCDSRTRQYADVEVRLRNGRAVSTRVYEQRGHPAVSPLNADEIRAKFMACAEPVIGAAAGKLWQTVAELETIEDCSELNDLLHAAPLGRASNA